MSNITFIVVENKWPSNNFNFLALDITNLMIPSNEMTNMHMAYH